MVPTVKDPSSDFALCARNGSATLRHQREKREKGKMRQRFWELGGSRMGKAMGVEDKAGDDKKEEEAKEEVIFVSCFNCSVILEVLLVFQGVGLFL